MKPETRKYYEAYEERYKTAHARGTSWETDAPTGIVMQILEKYRIGKYHRLLEVGCGEGRDARILLNNGYDLLATDISAEAIAYCRERMPQKRGNFRVLDCLSGNLTERFDFIYAVAVIHMLVLQEDRKRFYQFLYDHLENQGIAVICSMGDGERETESDIGQAFARQERNHRTGKMLVAGTSCKMVSWDTLEREIVHSGLTLVEKGMTSALPNFDRLMYAVVRR